MLFNSLEYLIFLPIMFFLYWFVFYKDFQKQNLLILFGSYLFYGWWDWRFLFLIIFSTVIDYVVGYRVYYSKTIKSKKILVFVSLVFNLSILSWFKYFNFFVDSWINLVSLFGYQLNNFDSMRVILPVGISFYTFQSISYTLDIYKKKITPAKCFISFATFVAFFPQLVAGPIERSSRLLPKIQSKRLFNFQQGIEGGRLIIWGLFKKVVIADSLAWRVDYCFNNYSILDGGSLALGLIYFSFQIYCDFSGYSDIAIGTAKLFGIELMSNFKFPYFSSNISKFWKRWHISLSSWFRDYLYYPIGGSKKGLTKTIRNLFVVFLLSGLWHGANLTFLTWGLCHALIYMAWFLYGNLKRFLHINPNNKNSILKLFEKTYQIILTFSIVTFAWVFFRSPSLEQSFIYIHSILSNFSLPLTNRSGLIFILPLIILEYFMKNNERNFFITNRFFINKILLLTMTFIVIVYFLNDYAYDKEMRQFVYFEF